MNARPQFLIRNVLPLLSLCVLGSLNATAAPTAAFPQPQPSNQEQYLLELINAARVNPAAEGQMLANVTDSEILRYYSYYKVNTGAMIGQFDSYAAKPPLAFNTDLMASSRQQSLYQASSGVQTHDSADGTTFDKRISATGYQWRGLGENVYAYAETPFFGHVGLMADWGVPSLDHRANLLNTDPSYPTFREIGISAVPSSVSNFGPLVITEDFGTPADNGVAYLVGVVYADNNGNGAYDEDEGLSDVTVSPDGTSTYAVTSGAGGFVIPLPTSGSGTLTITASGGALGGPRVKTVSYTAGTNVKVDFTTADPANSAPAAPALPVVTLSAPTAIALTNGQAGKIKIARSGDLSQPLAVSLTYGGSAVNGVDYKTLPTTVNLAAGVSNVTLHVLASSNVSGTKKVKARLAASTAYTVSTDKVQTLAKVKLVQAE